ncbi:pectinesterase inhibitor 1 [Cajanus cajan]|uniref:Pectinesterase inhibitor n=1 Tax=Cajanus cajan TaxID=3821 RepID=A0A151R4S4_CAJCA|nr:pectinesterase inhibitor 1 [Cajanus cajan]XP_020204841.1 pectinesterase inhibitor 1 [Cajanus cajan]KYP37432.1 Pectinesterase inhibitor [Cajanus cajan]KYP37435.1 Pectinesterase inhibitor [Cajanus cajan]
MIHNHSSLVLVFLLFVASSYAIPVEKEKEICKQTKNPSFCFSLLNSQPNADLAGLIQFTIKTTRANVTNTINLTKTLIAKSASDPNATKHYKSCLDHFNDALDNVDYTLELFKKGDYGGVGVAMSAVGTDVDDCLSGESPSDPPYNDPSQLPQYGAVVELLAIITIIISKSLFH